MIGFFSFWIYSRVMSYFAEAYLWVPQHVVEQLSCYDLPPRLRPPHVFYDFWEKAFFMHSISNYRRCCRSTHNPKKRSAPSDREWSIRQNTISLWEIPFSGKGVNSSLPGTWKIWSSIFHGKYLYGYCQPPKRFGWLRCYMPLPKMNTSPDWLPGSKDNSLPTSIFQICRFLGRVILSLWNWKESTS